MYSVKRLTTVQMRFPEPVTNYWWGTRLKRTLKRVHDPNHNNCHDTATIDLAILVNSMNLKFEIINVLGLFGYNLGEWRTYGLTNFEARLLEDCIKTNTFES